MLRVPLKVLLPQRLRARARIKMLARVEDRALYANAVFVLMVFCASAFFHPLSTEPSEWLPVLLATGLLTHLVSARVIVEERTRELPA